MGEQRVPHIRKSSLHLDEALYDGVKPWMSNSVRNWLHRRIVSTSNGVSTYYDNVLLHNIELHGRINLGVKTDGYQLYGALIGLFNSDENYALDIIQAVVELSKITPNPRVLVQSMTLRDIGNLNEIFIKSGSKWHVVVENDHARLEARVNETTTAAYKQLISKEQDYAHLLKTSWEYCYGRGPNPSEAYSYAVKAVEAVSWQVVTPANNSATLGTITKDLVAQSNAGKFGTIFNDKHENTSIEAITKMMTRLWEGHSDRHATGNYTKPSQQEAEAAVHIALLLCHLFATGSVIKTAV